VFEFQPDRSIMLEWFESAPVSTHTSYERATELPRFTQLARIYQATALKKVRIVFLLRESQ